MVQARLGLCLLPPECPGQPSAEPRVLQSRGKLTETSRPRPELALASELPEQPVETRMKTDGRQEREKQKWVMSESKS